jgi:hypothetical protein
MSDTLEFKGTWNPALGAFPVITDDTTACYYLVSEAGQVDGYTFNQGDWLIYVEEPISPTETHGRWYRSEGGIVQVAPVQGSSTPTYSFGEPGTYTKVTVNNAGVVTRGEFLSGSDIPAHTQDASTIANFTPTARTAVGPMFVNTARSKAVQFEFDDKARTVSADVRIDNVTIVKDEFGQLKVADSIAHATGGVVDPSDGDMLFPPEAHTHAAIDITDLRSAVRQSLAHTPDGQGSFFTNTANSNAVVFNYDLKTATVSADVKIDNTTIVKNKFGQLVAINSDLRPHSHKVEEIEGLDLDVLRNLTPAGEQALTSPTDGRYTDGLHNLLGYKINDAFDVVNVSLKTLTSTLTQINVNIDNVKPVPPPSLDKVSLELWKGHQLYTVAKADTGETLQAIFDRSPKTETTVRFAGSLAGTVVAVIDGSENTAAVRGVTEVDYYEGQPAYQGWYRALTARIEVQSNIATGPHTLQLRYKEGSTVVTSKPLNVYIAASQPNARVDVTNITWALRPQMTKYVSGIPAINTRSFTIGKMYIDNAVGHYYNPTAIVKIFGGSPGIAEPVTADPALIPTKNGRIEIQDVSILIEDKYAQPVSFQTQCYDVFDNEGLEQTIGVMGIRSDPSNESNRVRSGSAADIYPNVAPGFCGEPYDSTASLLQGIYVSELQLINNRYRWPSGAFAAYGGPNYTDARGTRLQQSASTSPEYRWATLSYSIQKLIAFDLEFKRANGTWPLTLNRTIPNIFIYARVVGKTGWIDINKPFVGYGGVIQNGQGALDVSKTSQNIRRVTFGAGAGPFTGTLLIRIGLPRGTEYEVDSNISIQSVTY